MKLKRHYLLSSLLLFGFFFLANFSNIVYMNDFGKSSNKEDNKVFEDNKYTNFLVF